jgi:hypothetical protein
MYGSVGFFEIGSMRLAGRDPARAQDGITHLTEISSERFCAGSPDKAMGP